MKANVDRKGCIGCGLCAGTCPEVFRIAEDGLSEVIGEVTEANEGCAYEAAEGCPVGAITIEE